MGYTNPTAAAAAVAAAASDAVYLVVKRGKALKGHLDVAGQANLAP
jgi:hypothetical protein